MSLFKPLTLLVKDTEFLHPVIKLRHLIKVLCQQRGALWSLSDLRSYLQAVFAFLGRRTEILLSQPGSREGKWEISSPASVGSVRFDEEKGS